MRRISWLWIGMMTYATVAAAQANDGQPVAAWTASWITHPTVPLREPVTLHFRRSFEAATGAAFVVRVSADNRYVLYLNGERIGDGPARGDLAHWRYRTYDLGPKLKPGMNTLSATVWNFGVYAPLAQLSDRTAFLVEGEGSAAVVNTDARWMVEMEPGQVARPRTAEGFGTYTSVGPGEELRAAEYDWGWQTEPTTNGHWLTAGLALRESVYPKDSRAEPKGAMRHNSWQLVADTLPPMLYRTESAGRVVRSDLAGTERFPAAALAVPAHAKVHVLLDRGALTTGYPRLRFSGGQGARVVMTYAEALFDSKGQKGDRDEVGDRQAKGISDVVLPDGSKGRWFETLWWRTWRYLDLEVTTGDEALTLDGLTAAYTAYPMEQKGYFRSSDKELDEIWKIGWHTLELAAHETYVDTPYYEQLQYVGDTRIESEITYAVTGDDRLPQQAMRAFDDSRGPDGLTTSRYPVSLAQYIPPFSLLWIGMVRDFAEYRSDDATVKQMLPGIRAVLEWFARYEDGDALLAKLPDWSFVDWTANDKPLPTFDDKGRSCTLTMEYAGALGEAAQLETQFGDAAVAARERFQAAKVKVGVVKACWDGAQGLMADSPKRDWFSSQSSTLAVLYDLVPKSQQQAVMRKVLAGSPTMIPASYYFDYYVARALEHAGMGDDYFSLLEQWRGLMKLHFSTWPEVPGETRSDSHAWSADPTLDLVRIVAGIRPEGFGFGRVRVEPHLGALTSVDAGVPWGNGMIVVSYRVKDGQVEAGVEMPAGLVGEFVWQKKVLELRGGKNQFELAP